VKGGESWPPIGESESTSGTAKHVTHGFARVLRCLAVITPAVKVYT